MEKKLTITKKLILKDLYFNIFSFAKKHLTPTNKTVFRIYKRSNQPIRNVEVKIFNSLIEEGYIKKTTDYLYIITAKGNQLFNKK